MDHDILIWTGERPGSEKHVVGKLKPICSMFGIFTYIWVIFRVNVGKCSIHGAYGKFYFGCWPSRFYIVHPIKKMCALRCWLSVIVIQKTLFTRTDAILGYAGTQEPEVQSKPEWPISENSCEVRLCCSRMKYIWRFHKIGVPLNLPIWEDSPL